MQSVPITDAGARWKELPRRCPLSARYVVQAKSWMTDFAAFIGAHHSAVQELADVQWSMGWAYIAKIKVRGVSVKDYNNTLIFLLSCFEALKDEGGIPDNPFAWLPTKDENTVFRRPYSEEDLAAIVKAAKEDLFTYPVVVASLCTAMRRGRFEAYIRKVGRREGVQAYGRFLERHIETDSFAQSKEQCARSLARFTRMAERRTLGEILSDEPVSVLVGAAFPVIGSGFSSHL